MTKNEENFINKINELQNVIEWQKKVIAQRDDELSLQTSIIEGMAQPKTCDGCKWWDNINDIAERAHPNWRYCDFNNSITHYQETENTFFCRDYEPKAQK